MRHQTDDLPRGDKRTLVDKRRLSRKMSRRAVYGYADFRLSGIAVSRLAEALCVSRQTVIEIIRERRAVSPDMALRLSRLFGNSPEFWLNAQRAVDLWDAEQEAGPEIKRVEPLTV